MKVIPPKIFVEINLKVSINKIEIWSMSESRQPAVLSLWLDELDKRQQLHEFPKQKTTTIYNLQQSQQQFTKILHQFDLLLDGHLIIRFFLRFFNFDVSWHLKQWFSI